jgi:hypothetical protein
VLQVHIFWRSQLWRRLTSHPCRCSVLVFTDLSWYFLIRLCISALEYGVLCEHICVCVCAYVFTHARGQNYWIIQASSLLSSSLIFLPG